MKKVLSLVLVIAMVLSSMSFAFAAPAKATDVAGLTCEEAVSTLGALGIINGYEDGSFKPEKTITRAEIMKILVEALGLKDVAAGATSAFSDLKGAEWAEGYIAIGTGMGLTVGYPGGTFKPSSPVTYDEAVTFIVRALGYLDHSSQLKGTWPTNFKVKAASLGITDGVSLKAGAANRGDVAMMVYNALEKDLVTVDADGKTENIALSKTVNETLLDRVATKVEKFVVDSNKLDKKDKKYAGNIVDLAPYMYQTLTVYENKDDEVVYIKANDTVVVSGTVTKAEAGKITLEDGNDNDKEYVINLPKATDTKITTYFNRVEEEKAVADLVDADVKVIINDKNANERFDKNTDVAEAVVATKATSGKQISKVYVTGKTKIDGIALPVTEDDDTVANLDRVVVTGDAATLEDIKEDAIITIYEGGTTKTDKFLAIAVSNKTVEGKITKASKDSNGKVTKVTVDGTAYDVSTLKGNDVKDLKSGVTGTSYINAEGEVFAFAKTKAEVAKNYAVVLGASNGEYDSLLDSVSKNAQIKLSNEKGKTVVYKVDEDAKINDLDMKTTGKVVEFPVVLKAGTVVEYSLTKEGLIDTIDTVVTKEGKSFSTESTSFAVADNAVIFDAFTENDKKVKEYGTLTVEQLKKDIVADVVYNDNGEIELLVVTTGVKLESTGTFAVITGIEYTTNNDDDEVKLLTAWVDGKKVEYMTNKATTAVSKSGKTLVELVLKDGAVTSVKTIDAKLVKDITVKDVNAKKSLVQGTDGVWSGLAEKAVVYLQTGTNAVEVVDFAEISEDDKLVAYNTNDDDDAIEYIIILKR